MANTTQCGLSRSRHPGGVQVVKCDGSAHFVSESIGLAIWQAMGSIDGGEVISEQPCAGAKAMASLVRGIWPCCLGLLAAGLSGCGGAGYDSVSLEGEFRIGGRPVEQGGITFSPLGPGRGRGVYAEVRSGRYRVDGVPVGKVHLTLFPPHALSPTSGPMMLPRASTLALFALCAAVVADRAIPAPAEDFRDMRGANYVPSYARNDVQLWMDYDPRVIDRELGWAGELGLNTTRCFLQCVVWKQDPEGFKKRLDRFLAIAHKHGITVMPVLFDDCAFGDPPQLDPHLGKQREPVPGMIAPSWTPSPGRKLGASAEERPRLEHYVRDVVGAFREDPRIIAWDLYNEPMNVVRAGTRWRTSAAPSPGRRSPASASATSSSLAWRGDGGFSIHALGDLLGASPGLPRHEQAPRPGRQLLDVRRDLPGRLLLRLVVSPGNPRQIARADRAGTGRLRRVRTMNSGTFQSAQPLRPLRASSQPLRLTVCMIAALAVAPLAAAEDRGVAPRQAAYRGWNAYVLENGLVRLHVVPEIGGRVIQYALGEKEFLWVNPALAGKSPPESGLDPEGGWLNYGGDKLWPAPQGWDNDQQWPGPPDAVLDGQPHRAEIEREPGAIRLTSRDDPRSGIRFSRRIRLDPRSTRVSVEATVTNAGDKPRRWGIWAHTQLDGGKADGPGHNPLMQAWCPLNPDSRLPKGYSVIFGPADNPSFQPDARRGLMRVQYQYKVGKIGLDSHAGWVATVDGQSGAVLVQRFVFEPKKEYPDGSSVEFWLNGTGRIRAYNRDMVMSADPAENPYVFESEVLSPFARLQPGESYTWRYGWCAANIGGDFPVLDCSDAGVTAEPLSAELAAGRARLKGRFGVFAPGSVRAELADAQGGRLQAIDLALKVSPLAPLVLDTAVAVPANAASVRLALTGPDGQAAGELGRADLRKGDAGRTKKRSGDFLQISGRQCLDPGIEGVAAEAK